MKKGKAVLVVVLDKSGSMYGKRDDAIGGFNSFIEEQKKVDGEAVLTAILFDTAVTKLYDTAPLDTVVPMTEDTYVPGGSTALLDALGQGIVDTGRYLEATPDEEKPERVIVAVITDGYENASKEHTRKGVADLIKHQQDKYGWSFMFLGAGPDSFQEAMALNFQRHSTVVTQDSKVGTQASYMAMSANAANIRATGRSLDMDAAYKDAEKQAEKDEA